jgi:hypothetical protein
VALAVALAALAPRVGPALRGYQPSNDAAEYLLIARALAAGDGFTLPIKVRHLDDGPAVHSAWAERAPLWPALLSLPVRAGVGREGWPAPHLQLLGAALAALAAALGVGLTTTLARQRGLTGWSLVWAGLAGGLVVAWSPFLVRASIHLWAEPFALLLVLGGLWLWLLGEGRAGRQAQALAACAGLLVGLARFARPEAWVLVALLLVLGWRRGRGPVAALAGAVLLVNVVGVAVSGVVAPQLFLFEVGHFEEAMRPGAELARPGLGAIVGGIASNLGGQLYHLLLPKNAFVVLPLALLGVRRAEPRPLLLAAAGLIVATAAVWSTHDPFRFTIAPLCLLAPVAAVEVEVLRRTRWPGRPWPLAIYLGLLVGVLGHAAGRELRKPPPPGAPHVTPRPGEPELADPWSYALVTGEPARLRPE